MYKKLWKKIYGQCRMWINAAEITLDPVPFRVEEDEDGNRWLSFWLSYKYHITCFVGENYTRLRLKRLCGNEQIIRE